VCVSLCVYVSLSLFCFSLFSTKIFFSLSYQTPYVYTHCFYPSYLSFVGPPLITLSIFLLETIFMGSTRVDGGADRKCFASQITILWKKFMPPLLDRKPQVQVELLCSGARSINTFFEEYSSCADKFDKVIGPIWTIILG
jgi:hypothetical protein